MALNSRSRAAKCDPIPTNAFAETAKQSFRSDASQNRTKRGLCAVQQDVLPLTSGYHDLMERIAEVKRGFAQRLYELRSAKGVSAREMSLSLGQGTGYVSNLENGHNLPSMGRFFSICEYLGLMPGDFLSYSTCEEGMLGELVVTARSLDPEDLRLLLTLARKMKPLK